MPLSRKKSLPDVQELPRATAPMCREEVSALGSARREEIRRQIELSDRLKANPLLYLVSPQVKVRFVFHNNFEILNNNNIKKNKTLYCFMFFLIIPVCWFDLNNKQFIFNVPMRFTVCVPYKLCVKPKKKNKIKNDFVFFFLLNLILF